LIKNERKNRKFIGLRSIKIEICKKDCFPAETVYKQKTVDMLKSL